MVKFLFKKGHKVKDEWKVISSQRVRLYWLKHREELIRKIRKGMAKPEVVTNLRILNSRKRRPMSEVHKTKISKALVGKLPSNMQFHNTYANIQNGEYDINGKVIYFRSKWEANVAIYLDFLKKQGQIKHWEFEVEWFEFKKIRHGTTRYLPDFRVTNNDGTYEYWEVKGYMDSRSKTKIKRMARYYPKIKLVIIDKEFMADLNRKKKLLKLY